MFLRVCLCMVCVCVHVLVLTYACVNGFAHSHILMLVCACVTGGQSGVDPEAEAGCGGEARHGRGLLQSAAAERLVTLHTSIRLSVHSFCQHLSLPSLLSVQ